MSVLLFELRRVVYPGFWNFGYGAYQKQLKSGTHHVLILLVQLKQQLRNLQESYDMLGECLSFPHNLASIWNEYWCLGCLSRCRPSVVISWQQHLLNLHKCCICLSHYERKTGVKSFTGKCSIAIIITSNTVEDGVHLCGDLPNARRSQLLRMCKLWNSIVAPKEQKWTSLGYITMWKLPG